MSSNNINDKMPSSPALPPPAYHPSSHGRDDITGGGGGGGNTASHVVPVYYTATPSEQAYTIYLLQLCFGISYNNDHGDINETERQSSQHQQQQQQQQQTTCDSFKISGRDAVPFLSKSGLSRDMLRSVWTLADPENVGSLTSLWQLHCILRIIALAQQQHGKNDTILAKAIMNDASSPIDAAMKQCLQDTAHHVIPLAVFDGIAVPPGDELQAIYVKYRNRNRGVGVVGNTTSTSCNSSVSSYSSGQYASNHYTNQMPQQTSSNYQPPPQQQQQAQEFATSSSATTTTSGHVYHHSMDHHAFPGIAHGADGDNNLAQSQPQHQYHRSMDAEVYQNMNIMDHPTTSTVFGGFHSTTAPMSCLTEQPSLMSVSDAFGDLVVNNNNNNSAPTTAMVPDLPPLQSHSMPTTTTTTTAMPAPSLGMKVHHGDDADDDEDAFGDFANASPTAAAATDTTTSSMTGIPNEYGTPSSSWGGGAAVTASQTEATIATTTTTTTTTSPSTAASGWGALDALAAADTPPIGVQQQQQQHETTASSSSPPPPFPMTATLSWDVGVSLPSSSSYPAAATVPPPFQAPVISSSSTAASNISVASAGWDALDALAESSSAAFQPGSVMSMSMPTTTTAEAAAAAPVAYSLPMTDSMDDRKDEDDDFGDFNSGTSVSAPPPLGMGQGFSLQGQQQQPTLVTPEMSESLDVLDMQEQPETSDYHTSFLPEQPAPTVLGWGALDALVDHTVQDAPLPGLSSLSMGAGESLEVQEDHRQPSVGTVQNSDDDDFSGFVNADVSEPLSPAKLVGTDETPERVDTAVETDALEGINGSEEEFGAFSNDNDAQLSKQVAETAVRTDPISSGEVVAGGEAGVRGVSFSPAFDTGAGTGRTTRPPLPPQDAFNKSERSDSAYYSARSYSMNSAAMSSEYSLDGFSDALQSLDDSNNAAATSTKTPEAGTKDPALFLDSAGSIPPSTETSDDPFAAFDALSAPPPQLPPLSSFAATVPPDTSDLNVVHANLSNDEVDTSGRDRVGMNPSLAMTTRSGLIMPDSLAATAARTQDDFGSLLTHGDGSGNQTAPSTGSADEFGAFDSPTDDQIPDGSAAPETKISGALFTRRLEMTNDDVVEASEGTDFGDFVAAAPVSDIGDATKAALGDEPESSPGMVEISETDDFGDFETAVSQDGEEAGCGLEAPAAVIPEHGAAEASEGTDGFGDFEAAPLDANSAQEAAVAVEIPHSTVSASPSTVEAIHDSDDFGDFGDFSGPITNLAHGAGMGEIAASRTSERQEDGWDAFKNSASTDTGHLDRTPPSSPQSDADRDNLCQIREKIVAQSFHLPEGIRRKSGASGALVDFGDCFDANIGIEFPVSMERKLRMSRCLQLLDEISNHPKLVATNWAQVISTARDELAMGSFLLDEGLSLSTQDQKKVAQPLEGYVHGLGECVRVVRCIAATLGDLLMLDPSALLTIDTWASSWCGIPLLKDALEVEKLWESIREKSKKVGLVDKQEMSHKLESLVQIRSTRPHGDINTRNGSTPLLCQLSLQPLSLSKDVHSTTQAVVEWDGRHFMACSANFLANKCAFNSVQNS